MEFRILGPLEIVVDDHPVPTPAPRLCMLLTTLLLRPHRVVPVGELIDRLWADETLPANPTSSIHTYVRRLRAIVGADVLQTRPGGYLLAAEATDLVAFRSYLAEAADDPARKIEHLQRALDQWRGEPLAVEHHYAVGLVEERLTALEQYYDARLAQGDHADLLPELRASSAKEPLRERFSAQLMIALYRCGRQAEALAAYDEIADRLVDQFGLDPGDELRELRQSILTSTLEAPSPPSGDWTRQNQLPLDIRTLIGRDDLINEVVKLAVQTSGVPIVVLTGTPGVGKTALAVRVAHQLASSFTDGLWFVRLRGASDQPRRPDDVLVDLLRSSGVDPRAIPDDLDARAAAFRARLAGRRVLLVLDDARDAAQVRPLLPGTPGSAVLITSRNTLAGLVALEGATGLSVATLTPGDGASLVTSLLSRPAPDDLQDAVAELVAMCAGLPLALRIAGAVATHGSVAGLVSRMRAAGALPLLTIDDDTAVSTAFTTSYDLLDPAVQRGFRLLSLFPGPEFGERAAEALIGPEYADVLTRLESAGLLQPVGRGRYVMHDLVKEYGVHLGTPELEAWNALCAWYIGTADFAVHALLPTAVRLPVTSYQRVPVDDPTDWLESELVNIEAVATRALAVGPSDTAWLVADILRPYLYQHSLTDLWRKLVELGVRSAPQDPLARGAMEHALGVLARITGDAESVTVHGENAIELYRSGGFVLGEAALLCNLGLASNDQGQLRKSAELLAAGIELFRSIGEIDRLPTALLNQSLNYLHLGRFRDTIECATECLALTAAGDSPVVRINRAAAYLDLGRYDEAAADLASPPDGSRLDLIAWKLQLAEFHRRLHDHATALQHASDALADSLEVSSNYHECFSRLVIGEIHLHDADHAAARSYFEQVDTAAGKSGYGTILADVHYWLAECTFREGRTALAHELAAAALTELEAVEYCVGTYHAQDLLARCDTALGRDDDAALHAAAAGRIHAQTGYIPGW
ncbi:NACHT domain-containing protein [Kribbella capetownensis]|uniref:NACHT domain-containing protein n=1 Tax=Kribbella capetownensis TaxID=1572659 RepID=A0A4R0JHJ4_9ACTN|nr:BTAD domain-containing putative transcriptional regulator [Kribbella capetownensis]TCC44098.1 NACHT domain-containing protein [Kribbella capetownensis]